MGMLNAQRMRAARVVFDIGFTARCRFLMSGLSSWALSRGTIWTDLGYEF